jgi:hypothetical protein
MQPFPHHYTVSASGQPESPVTLEAENLPELITAPPLAFGGPGDRWSPAPWQRKHTSKHQSSYSRDAGLQQPAENSAGECGTR